MKNRVEEIRQRIAHAAQKSGRSGNDIQLLAVSKTRPVDDIKNALTTGLSEFGENYLQDALTKIPHCSEKAHWHFIGPLQSNKCADVALHFDWLHTVDREKIINRCANARTTQQKPLNICIQVNISDELAKSGCLPEHAQALCEAVERHPTLQLRGLMGMAGLGHEPRPEFEALKQLFDRLAVGRDQFDTLSMGMSGDFETAIECGSTLVRIGTAIFGERLPRN